ncbi:hypothetical protein EMIT0180MI3_30101 [Priestia megaterium]
MCYICFWCYYTRLLIRLMVLLFVVSAEDEMSGGDLKPLGGKTHVSNFNETITRSWCTFRSPNSPLEPKDEEIHLH